MRTNKNRPKIILALVVAFLATMISYSAFSNMHKQLSEQQQLIEIMQKTQKPGDNNEGNYAYAVATTDLKAGEIVSDKDVDFQQFEIENKDAFENRSDIINKVLLKDISNGDTFTSAHIAKISNDNVELREGYRALTLPADNFQGKSLKMVPGSAVDIYGTGSDSSWALEGVKIVSFEPGKNAAPGVPTQILNASAITFEVATDDISDFISNISKGKLMLVTRGANDTKIVHKKTKHSYSDNDNMGSIPSLPKNLSANPPIGSLGDDNLSGLPQPIQPIVQQPSVEVIEANVKSKVTFD